MPASGTRPEGGTRSRRRCGDFPPKGESGRGGAPNRQDRVDAERIRNSIAITARPMHVQPRRDFCAKRGRQLTWMRGARGGKRDGALGETKVGENGY